MADYIKSHMVGYGFNAQNLSKKSFRHGLFNNSDFRGSDLSSCDFEDTSLVACDFTGAKLRNANLKYATCDSVSFVDADMSNACLREAHCPYANFYGADLTGADVTGAVFNGANLHGSLIEKAKLDEIKEDLFQVLERAPNEVPALLHALKNGLVDGSYYEGDCCCLVGTLAKARGCKPVEIGMDADRPAERWFMGISVGEVGVISKITIGWLDDFKT